MTTSAPRFTADPMVLALVSTFAFGVQPAVARQRVGPSGHLAAAPPTSQPAGRPARAEPMSVDAAARVLSDANVFAGPQVGFFGTEPTEYAAFRVIVAQPDAADRLDRMSRSTNAASQLYGLLGLRRIDPERYARMVENHDRSNAVVTTYFECFRGRDTVEKVVASWGPVTAGPGTRPSERQPSTSTRP